MRSKRGEKGLNEVLEADMKFKQDTNEVQEVWLRLKIMTREVEEYCWTEFFLIQCSFDFANDETN